MNLHSEVFPKYKNKFVYLNNIISPHKKSINEPSFRPKIKALIASRIIYDKGIDIAINAMNELSGFDIYLDIYGDGNEINSFKAMSTNPNTIFKGYSDNLNNLWESYNLFLLPSRREGMSNSLLEAQLNNIYSIVSNCKTGNKEIIDLTKNGVCFNTGDYRDLKKRIIYFYKNEYMSKDSNKLIAENFSDTNAKTTLERTLPV